MRIVSIHKLAAAGRKLELVGRKALGNGAERGLKLKRQLFAAELAHELDLVLDQDDLALVDHPDPICHFLGLVDIMGRENHRHAGSAQRAHERPHIASELDIDTCRRLVKKQNARLV